MEARKPGKQIVLRSLTSYTEAPPHIDRTFGQRREAISLNAPRQHHCPIGPSSVNDERRLRSAITIDPAPAPHLHHVDQLLDCPPGGRQPRQPDHRPPLRVGPRGELHRAASIRNVPRRPLEWATRHGLAAKEKASFSVEGIQLHRTSVLPVALKERGTAGHSPEASPGRAGRGEGTSTSTAPGTKEWTDERRQVGYIQQTE